MADRLPTGMSVPLGAFTVDRWSCTADLLNPQATYLSGSFVFANRKTRLLADNHSQNSESRSREEF